MIGFKAETINGLGATSGNNSLVLEAAPYIKSGRTMVPIRAVAEPFGAKVDWDSASKTITVSFQGHTVKLTVGKNTAIVDNATKTLDVAPEIVNGRTFVPARFVSEALDMTVKWDAKTKTVSVTYP
jgi:hypothetical protein